MRIRSMLVVASVVLLAFATTALGNTDARCTPSGDVEINQVNYPAGVPVSTVTTYNGAVYPRSFTGSDTMTVPYTGPGTVTSVYFDQTFTDEVGSCVTTTPPPSPPVVTPPPTNPPPVVTPPPTKVPTTNCLDLIANGAGKKWLKKFGCTPPRPALTCQDLKERGAGRSWYERLGIRYYECNIPKQPPGRRTPAVTG